jgi:hypothetical protein
MKKAIRKLDDTEFKNPFDRSYIRVKEDTRESGGVGGGRERSRSRSPKRRDRKRSYRSDHLLRTGNLFYVSTFCDFLAIRLLMRVRRIVFHDTSELCLITQAIPCSFVPSLCHAPRSLRHKRCMHLQKMRPKSKQCTQTCPKACTLCI